MKNCIERIKALEPLFSDDHYNGSGETAFFFREGTVPVMVSAPHAVNHFRSGSVKYADMFTGGIARYLHETTGCHMICSSRFAENDWNYDAPKNNRYQRELAAYVSEHHVRLLLDLHGAARTRRYAVEMGTAPYHGAEAHGADEEDPSLHQYKFIDDVIQSIFLDAFRARSIAQNEVWKNTLFDAGRQNTVTRYISRNTDTACIQLELNRNFRDPQNPEQFMGLIEALSGIIDFFAGLDWQDPSKQVARILSTADARARE